MGSGQFGNGSGRDPKQTRQDRLEEALRANLKRRKEQSRARGVTPSRGGVDRQGGSASKDASHQPGRAEENHED